MTRNYGKGKAWPPNTPGAREAEDDIQQLIPTPENNAQGLEDQMDNSNEGDIQLLTPTPELEQCSRIGRPNA